MQDDGNLVLYDSLNKTLWATNTTGQGTVPFKLTIQDDGNLVLKDSTNKLLWASDTAGKKF